jgi:hypothetical protein
MYAMIETLPRWSNSPQDFRACGVRVHSQGTAGLEPLSHRMHLDSYLITIGLQVETSAHHCTQRERWRLTPLTPVKNTTLSISIIASSTTNELSESSFSSKISQYGNALSISHANTRPAGSVLLLSPTKVLPVSVDRTSHVMWAKVSDGAAFYI